MTRRDLHRVVHLDDFRKPRSAEDIAAEQAIRDRPDLYQNLLDASGFKLTTYERHLLKRDDSRRAGRQPDHVPPVGLAAFLYNLTLWIAAAVLFAGSVLTVWPS